MAFKMEARKLIKFGNSSHIVSIPKTWIKENKLKKGDLLYWKKNSSGELILFPKEKEETTFKKAVINVTGKDNKLIDREILAAYIKGFNILSLTAPDIKKRTPEIKKMLKNLIGIDILEKNSKEIVAADFLDIKSVSLNTVIRRMDNNLRSMFEDLELSLEKKKIGEREFKEIYETDEDVNKFYFLLWKITVLGLSNPSVLHKLDLNHVELTHTWWLGMSMERIGDELKRIAREFKNTRFKKDILKKFFSVFMIVKNAYLDSMSSYYKKDIRVAYDVISKKRDVMGGCNLLSSDDLKIGKIIEKLKTTQSCIHNIAKCTIYFT